MGEPTVWKPVLGMRRIKNFRGRQRSAGAGAAGDQHAAINQNCRAVIDARGVQRCARAGGLRFRIENFRGGDEVAVAVASAGDQDPAIGERGGGVTCAREWRGYRAAGPVPNSRRSPTWRSPA